MDTYKDAYVRVIDIKKYDFRKSCLMFCLTFPKSKEAKGENGIKEVAK